MAQPLIKIGYGSGNPASCPDFRPLNPWGRPMPPPDRPTRPALYQVYVYDKRTGKIGPVGPQWAREFAEVLRVSIANQIALGAERRYREPHLVLTKL